MHGSWDYTMQIDSSMNSCHAYQNINLVYISFQLLKRETNYQHSSLHRLSHFTESSSSHTSEGGVAHSLSLKLLAVHLHTGFCSHLSTKNQPCKLPDLSRIVQHSISKCGACPLVHDKKLRVALWLLQKNSRKKTLQANFETVQEIILCVICSLKQFSVIHNFSRLSCSVCMCSSLPY